MYKQGVFSIYHPALIFLYIGAAILCSMLTVHPVYVGISFVCASIYSVFLHGISAYLRSMKWMGLMMLLIAAANPLLNHQGIILLFYLFDNPVTLETVLYGLCSAVMLGSVMLWFMCYNAIMTNDRFLYLFSHRFPGISLMLSMILKLIPVTQYKIASIQDARRGMGMNANEATAKQKISDGMKTSSILLEWSMEDSIETADSMKARGFGAGKRTCFSYFRWEKKDIAALVIFLALLVVSVFLLMVRGGAFQFYPTFTGELLWSGWDVAGYLVYAAFLLFPLLLELEDRMRMLKI